MPPFKIAMQISRLRQDRDDGPEGETADSAIAVVFPAPP